jgi:protocatechuate 3,4-dioxygenase beta subunit
MVVVALLIVALAGAQASQPVESPGRIAGRVTAEGTNAPVASARVILMSQGRSGPFGPPPQATTDRDGRFAFDRVAPGDYRIEVQKAGYAPLSDPFAHNAQTVHVVAGQAADVELHIQKGAAISGRVIDAMGEPVAEVRVMAMRRVPERAAPGVPPWIPAMGAGQQTNDLGEFRVSGLPPGEYLIAAMPQEAMSGFGGPGIAPATAPASRPTTTTTTYYPGTSDQAAAQPIAVAAGSDVGNIVFTMQSVAAYRVSGVVVDENGAPVAGAWVMLMGDPRSGLFTGRGGSANTQDDGRFTIEGVVSGTYRATASIPIAMGGTPVTGGIVNGISSGAVGGISAGVVGGGPFATWSVGGPGMPAPPAEVVVTDANVTGVRVVVRRPS